MAITFTHSLAEIAPYEMQRNPPFLGASTILSYNKRPQYTSYNGDVYTTIGVVPTFFVQTTGSFTSSGLWWDYFGGDGTDTNAATYSSTNSNIGLLDANRFTDFNYIFDVYQLDERIPNLQDIFGYRYNQYEMYGINTYNAGKKIKNLGRYKVAPHPQTGLGSLNISRVLRAHEKPKTTLAQGLQYPGYNVYEDADMSEKVRNLINKSDSSLYGNPLPWYRPDTENGVKWNIEYGFEVNPGLTFSDTYYSLGSYINPGTGQVATYSLGFTFSYPHYLKYGDEIIIQMNDLSLNPQYNGLCYVVDVVNPYHIVVDKMFGDSSLNEDGSVTYLLRTNEIQTGNWWKYVNSRYVQSGYYIGIYPLGFLNGRQITNYSINATTQRNLLPAFNNYGQVGIIGQNVPDFLQKTVINDVGNLLVDKYVQPSVRLENELAWQTPRFFMTNWNDTYMGRKELNFYTWGPGGSRYTNIPNYTLGALSHQNYWPAYFRNFDFFPSEAGEKLSTVATFNTLRYTWLSATGSVKATYDAEFRDVMPNTISNFNNLPFDYEKFEMTMCNHELWSLQFNDVPVQDDILRVELVKKYIDSWQSSEFNSDQSQDFNTIMDFDGADYDNASRRINVSAYPFHYQWSDYYQGECENWGSFQGPFGTLQKAASPGNFRVHEYNFKQTSATVSVNDANWPYTVASASNNRGYWFSELKFQVSDPSCGPVRVDLLRFNELYADGYGSDVGTNQDLGYRSLPAGTYSIDYIVLQATQSSPPDVLNLAWNIGSGQTLLPLGATGTLHRDVELYSPDGGGMWFEAGIDPAGSIAIQPLKIRIKSDIILARKEFKCNVICRGLNPYTIPFGKWDYGQQVELMFLNRLGSYERLYFELDSKRTINITRNTYSKSMIRDRWGLFNEKHTKGILSQVANEQYLINSDWLSQNKLTFYEELLTSPEVYVVQRPATQVEGSAQADGYTNGLPIEVYIPVNIQDTSFQNKTYLRDKLFNLQLTIQMAFDLNLQNQ
jgi:hypothetical protein